MSEIPDYHTRFNRVMRYNRCRIDRALSIFNPQQRPLFFALPFLLNINHQAFPGYIEDDQVPYGLVLYAFNDEDQQAVSTIFPEQQGLIDQYKIIWPKQRFIESLSLMGSIGTIAQSEKSDLDYWVCVDGRCIESKGWNLLQQKLYLIEQWVWDSHHLEVHFFLSDIERVRNNDFGAAGGESAGSAQPMFLKNEYYSTNIVISGKIPFWWIVSCGCNDEQYQQAYQQIQKSTKLNPKYLIDLGNIEKLHANEMFGATIWQLTKAMDSPFKSVLKMAKLEVFSDDTDNRTPLCHLLKARIHSGGKLDKDIRGTDPYTLMFDLIFSYYQKTHPKYLELFKACLYIKSGCHLSHKRPQGSKDFKRDVIIEYLREWQWNGQKIESFDNVDQWCYQRVSFLGKMIHSFLIGCYRRISDTIHGQQQLVTDEDMTVIGRKISSFYGDRPGKIQYLKRAFESGLMQLDITIKMELDLNSVTKQLWSAFRGRVHFEEANRKNPCHLKDSCDPVDLVLWCIFNRIISNDSQFYFLQSQLTICAADISELMDEVLLECQPVRVAELPTKQLLAPCQIVHCLLVLNFASHSSIKQIESVRVIYLTSWGELYSFDQFTAFMAIKKKFVSQLKLPICRLFTPSRNDRKTLYRLIETLTDFQFDKVGIADVDDMGVVDGREVSDENDIKQGDKAGMATTEVAVTAQSIQNDHNHQSTGENLPPVS